MRIDWRNDHNAPRCRTIDLDTGEILSPCAMADEEAGIVERYLIVDGIWQIGVDGRVATVTERRRVRIERPILRAGTKMVRADGGYAEMLRTYPVIVYRPATTPGEEATATLELAEDVFPGDDLMVMVGDTWINLMAELTPQAPQAPQDKQESSNELCEDEPMQLPHGISKTGVYRVYWKDGGGCSVASIGCLHDGRLWMAPANWSTKEPDGIATDRYWDRVARVELIMSATGAEEIGNDVPEADAPLIRE